MRSRELSVELRDRIMSRHRSGEGYKNILEMLSNLLQIKNLNITFTYVFRTFALRIEIERRSTLFPFIRIVSRHRSGEGYYKMSAALKVPNNTMASIILIWKKFVSIKTLSRAGCPAKLSNRGRRALVREVSKNSMVTLTKLQFLCGNGRTFQKYNHLCSTPPNRPLW